MTTISHKTWLPQLVGPERYDFFMALAGNDHGLAAQCHDYDVGLRDALRPELEHVELMLRNGYHATMQKLRPGHPSWFIDPALPVLRILKARYPKIMKGLQTDELKPFEAVSQLTFGFWRQLTASALEKELWVPYLHQAFIPGTDRARVHSAVAKVVALRNRVHHYEPVLLHSLDAMHDEMLWICGQMLPPLAEHRRSVTAVPRQLAAWQLP